MNNNILNNLQLYKVVMDYDEGIGWHDATIRPYGPIEMNPATVVLHYAQE